MTSTAAGAPNASRNDGFTLIELLLAVAITAVIMTAVGGTFLGILRTRENVRTLSESTNAGPRILTMLERDLYGLWHYNIKDNKVLLGQNRDIAGFDADRINLLTTTDAIGVVLDGNGEARRPSICEVAYWLKENDRYPDLRELWRREDPMVDDDLSTGGTFQLVHDRIKNFNITYYKTLGAKAEPYDEWDSSQHAELPRRIKIEFTVERALANRNRVSGSEVGDLEETMKKYTRHIVFDPRYPEILKAGKAMVPVLPPQPEAAEMAAGGGGAGGGGRGGESSQNLTQLGNGGPGMGEGASGRGGTTTQVNGPSTTQVNGPSSRGASPFAGAGGNQTINLGELLRGGGGGGGLFGSGGLFGGQ